ncbi:MAG: PhoX family phosphatase [Methylicorpusculum sp.]|uniref:PhoX family protein n=1 Tax=Methylicorpusculum sp. TaxID=2713644 RepID=UPI0027236897|nr:PhoX family phosphatase [Methylicorpusculum sp.]MDO8843747.1 PhoX family phosphatase [Methylicorpusculum sp.]MDO8938481.1 PhoX family phosphatase [Methylicorpusculum sp.]MDP2200416.1 PhoX family phosphatase [Methylicorpusculum sp.]
MNDFNKDLVEIDSGDEPMSNLSDNPHFSTILEKNLSRRQMLTGSLGVAVAGMFGASGLSSIANAAPGLLPPAAGVKPPFALNPALSFTALPVLRSDTATVPDGYKVQTLAPWGTPITGTYPVYKANGSNTGAEQEQQVGSHHDGIHYFPMPSDPNGHGLLCINHEYVDQNIFHQNGATLVNGQRPTDEVRKEIAGHGVSVVEVKKDAVSGEWNVVNGRYNRRVTAETHSDIRGPVRGSDLVKTLYSPNGTTARGTINNCGNGYTPWGTYLTCEENWAGYFVNKTGRPREHSRYGVSTSNGRYRWETAQSQEDQYVRFDASVKGTTAIEDYRNEPNGHGWILEIDPFDPNSTPKKRTALGRFAHEGCVFAAPQLGQPLTFYSGDDSQNEYIYKFVTKARYTKTVKGDILDEGTLYVARFNDDGTGTWLALDYNNLAFQAAAAEAGVIFKDQADVLVNTRLAADVVGATKMDRPEWGAVHPQTREVYFTLTNNGSRNAGNIDAANPRGPNPTGHIIRWREQGNRSWAEKFEWDIFVLAGAENNSQVLPEQGGPALTQDNIFASPDGLWIDQNGILWIQTDMSGSQQASGPFGANAMLAANPVTGEIKRFLVGPNDQETTGVVSTPDGKNLFVNFQHPGDRSGVNSFTSNWPDSGAVYRHPGDAPVVSSTSGARPRSSTIVITREDGGIVGL